MGVRIDGRPIDESEGACTESGKGGRREGEEKKEREKGLCKLAKWM